MTSIRQGGLHGATRCLCVLLLAAAGAGPLRAQTGYPELSLRREAIVSGLGAGMLLAGLLLDGHEQIVPSQGLDPAGISWSVDRDVVGNRDAGASTASDWTRNAAIVFPAVLALLVAEPGQRWDRVGPRTAVYAETFLFSMGATALGKVAWSRPRPYTYLAEELRPEGPNYDVTRERAFRSMPSGHSSSAWTGVGLAATELLLLRPHASSLERLTVGLVGGGLAGATSALRVKAGQHFPSDVIAGAGLGLATGVVVPLLHRDGRPAPSGRAWLEVLGGTVAGTLVAVLVAQ